MIPHRDLPQKYKSCKVNCMNDSGEFQEIESNYGGQIFLTFPVNKQSFQVLDKRLPLDTWNLSEPQGNFFGNPRPMLESSQTPHQGILHCTTPCATDAVPVQVSTGRPLARGEERTWSMTTMPMSERRPSTMNSFLPVEIPQNSMAGQQRLKISELHFEKFLTPSSFTYWKIRFKTQVSSCFDFPSDAMVWIKEVEMVDSVDDFKSSHSIQEKTYFPNFEM